jgi:hypothetical protein
MFFFIDTEFNGFGGDLMSLALVPESKTGKAFYVTIKDVKGIVPWVQMNVVPHLKKVPEGIDVMGGFDLTRDEAARLLGRYIHNHKDVVLCADWPEDFAQVLNLLIIGPGQMVNVPDFECQYKACRGFNTADHSTIPHNALADAIALKDYWLA